MSPAPSPLVEAVRAGLGEVEDPELPVSIVDLGMVRGVAARPAPAGGTAVEVVVVPTFLGCSAQLFIEADIEAAARGAGADEVVVTWSSAPAWSLGDVTPEGRARLEAVGIALPSATGALRCPHCGHDDVTITSEFGATLCRRSAFCPVCRTPFDVLKSSAEQAVSLRTGR